MEKSKGEILSLRKSQSQKPSVKANCQSKKKRGEGVGSEMEKYLASLRVKAAPSLKLNSKNTEQNSSPQVNSLMCNYMFIRFIYVVTWMSDLVLVNTKVSTIR